jgi:hypothetical protein
MRSQLQRSEAVFQQICEEDLQTALRVRTSLVSPDGMDDDVMLVWHKLAMRYPDNASYDYTVGQILWAWRAVRQVRARHDHIGLGGPRAEARRRRRQALAMLAADLQGQEINLLRLDVGDYHPEDCMLAIGNAVGQELIKLSNVSARAIDRWLKVRANQPGPLFQLPNMPCYREESLYLYPEVVASCARVDPALRAEQEDMIERLCQGKSELVCAFVLENMCEKGGDWSLDLIERIRRRCGSFAGRPAARSSL